MQKLFAPLATVALTLAVTVGARADSDKDFGLFRDRLLNDRAEQLFGVNKPLAKSSEKSISAAEANSDPTALVTLAGGLRAQVVSAAANLGPNVDMMALWPDDVSPTHLIFCNEEGPGQPGVQRVSLRDGTVETILTGTSSCDPSKRTPWGTVIVGEEVGNTGWVIEIIDPLHTTGVTFNRVTGTFSGGEGTTNLATRPALGRNAFEGIALYPNGVVYYGDENRPLNGTSGGAYFKFIPSTPWAGGAPITRLSDSPLTSGKVYGMRLGRRSGNTDFGQGSNTGQGAWIEIPAPTNPAVGTDLRAAAATLKLSGYYRPEDLDIDQVALASGKVRFCGNNTGNEIQAHNWGEAICITDGTVAKALTNAAVPELQLFVAGTPELAMPDNIAFQPGRGNWIIHEDGDGAEQRPPRNNDLWSCLEDGDDVDSLSDGCVRIGSLNDLNAEWTGGIFDARGSVFYVSVQHNVTGHGVILAITGWR